jgi:AraC-like DNA-binding protein
MKRLFIKNMVCDRCSLVVGQVLKDLKLPYQHIALGEVDLAADPDKQQLEVLDERLRSLGFELLDDKKSRLVEKIKNRIIALVRKPDDNQPAKKLSVILEDELDLDYHYISGLFSGVEGITIEKYLILQRIESAKELLVYDELTLGEIADRLGYSSVQHLSQQFRKITGLTPTHFKSLKHKDRRPLDKII